VRPDDFQNFTTPLFWVAYDLFPSVIGPVILYPAVVPACCLLIHVGLTGTAGFDLKVFDPDTLRIPQLSRVAVLAVPPEWWVFSRSLLTNPISLCKFGSVLISKYCFSTPTLSFPNSPYLPHIPCPTNTSKNGPHVALLYSLCVCMFLEVSTRLTR
jgi:hypothetical protein